MHRPTLDVAASVLSAFRSNTLSPTDPGVCQGYLTLGLIVDLAVTVLLRPL